MTLQAVKEAYERHFTEPRAVSRDEIREFLRFALDFYAQGRVSIVYRPAQETEDEVYP